MGVLDYLVDDRVGIVKLVEERLREPGTPDFFHFYGQACDTAAFVRQDNFAYTGGASQDRDRAIAKAVGEAVERYSSAIFDIEELPLVPAAEAGFECVDPASFALFSPDQYQRPDFPWVRFTPKTKIRWAEAFEFPTWREVRVPAAMVYVPYYYYEDTGDAAIVQPISTGLACHSGYPEAVVSGICEVIERDAFTIAWQARLNPPRLMIETLSDENYELVQRFERTGARVTIFDITTDLGVPTFLSVLVSKVATSPSFALAASTGLSPEAAVRDSLEELTHTRRYSHLLKTRMGTLDPGPDFVNVKDQASHLSFWADHANLDLAAFLFTSTRRVDFDDLEDLSTGDAKSDALKLAEMVNRIGHKVYISDLTTPDVGRLGLAVIRAVIPGFHPLFMGHPIRALGGERLWTVPQQLGYPGLDPAIGDNPIPHPYP